VLVHPHRPEVGDEVLEEAWPDVTAIADADLALYDAFDLVLRPSDLLGRATLPMLMAGVRATMKGHRNQKPDSRPGPGMFLLVGDRVVWGHPFPHPGWRPDLETLPWTLRDALAAEGLS
jgi:hypothetical protein